MDVSRIWCMVWSALGGHFETTNVAVVLYTNWCQSNDAKSAIAFIQEKLIWESGYCVSRTGLLWA